MTWPDVAALALLVSPLLVILWRAPRHPMRRERADVRRVQRRRLRQRAKAHVHAGRPERIERERGSQGWGSW